MTKRNLARLATAICLAASLAGCSDLGKSIRPTGYGELSTTSLGFGAIAIGDSLQQPFYLINVGGAELDGSIGAASGPFSVISGGGAFALSPGESLAVEVQFRPLSPGTFTCALSSGSKNPSVTLSGSGVSVAANAVCDESVASLDFGEVTTGQSSDLSFDIRSVGTDTLSVNVISLCSTFSIVGGGGPNAIPPGDSLVVTVRFSPTTTGSVSCGADLGAVCGDVSLNGTGVSPPITVHFANDIQPIFTANCTSCHGVAGNGGMDLRAGVSYANIVNVVSQGYAPAVRIKPYDTGASVLYGKITNSGQYGGGMPPTGPISTAQRTLIHDWIVEGAPDN